MIGKQVLNYEINSLLGEGGMGSVYLATHRQLGRKVAIKALNPSLVRNPLIRARFKNEAATLSALHHPHIVILYDYLEEDDALYLVMEYVDGKPLDEYIRTVSGPVPEAKAIPLFAQVLDGFSYAHEQGIIHRDVKPANLMITPQQRMKILDFGIAKLVSHNNLTLTKTGTKMGTVLYMSPEQVKGEPVDHRSDIYSLGVTLFQMLTGRGPYEEVEASEFVVYGKIVNEPLPAARGIYPGVSERMEAVLNKATAKLPANRFQSCQEFREALLYTTAAAPAPASVRPAEKVVELIKPVQKPLTRSGNTTTNILVAIGVLLLIGVLLYGAVFSGKNTDESVSSQQVKRKTTQTVKKDRNEEVNGSPAQTEPDVEPEPESTEPLPADDLSGQASFSDVRLVYEVREPESPNNPITLLIVLNNESGEVNFDGVTLKITYFDGEDHVLGNYVYEHGYLSAGSEERFLIERKVPRAVRAECAIISGTPSKVEPTSPNEEVF